MSEGRIECSECGETSPTGSKFCESCGLMFSTRPAPTSRRPATRKGKQAQSSEPDRAERVAVGLQLTKARSALRGVHFLYIFIAVMYSLVAAIALWAASSGVVEEDLGLVAAITTILALFAIVGAIAFYSKPLVFTLVLACLATLDVAFTLIAGQIPILTIVLAIMLWCAVPIVWGVENIRKQYPDLVDAQKIRGKRTAADAPTSAALARAEQRRIDQRRAATRTAAWVVGAVVLVVGGFFTWKAVGSGSRTGGANAAARSFSPEELSSMAGALRGEVAKFRRCMDTKDIAAIEKLFLEERRIQMWVKTERGLKRRGWHENAPRLAQIGEIAQVAGDSHDVWYDFESGGDTGTLKTHWKWRDDRWQLYRIGIARD